MMYHGVAKEMGVHWIFIKTDVIVYYVVREEVCAGQLFLPPLEVIRSFLQKN